MSNSIMIQSPIKKVRHGLGLTTYDFATRSGISASTQQLLEKATLQAIPGKVLAFLSSHGIDPDALQRDYQEYRKALQAL